MTLRNYMRYNQEVSLALQTDKPVVALESAVITHGMPYPENFHIAQSMQDEIRSQEVTPATIAVMDGMVQIGLEEGQLERLSTDKGMIKISRRDFAPAFAAKRSGGTTVAGTILAGRAAGLRVFATGGIGGIHRNAPFDVSPDLPVLACTPMVVVCAGAKAILDLPATIEYLETMGVPVVGYETDEFPAFYSRESGLRVQVSAQSVEEIAAIARSHWEMGFESAVLVVVPPPPETALQREAVDGAITLAVEELHKRKIYGQAVTPFLLNRVSELTGGDSLKTNIALLLNNARVAARIASILPAKISQST